MRKISILVALAVGIIFAGSWVAAQAQTGDCYATLPGCLDPSFGTYGRATIPSGMNIYGVAVQMIENEDTHILEPRIVTVGQIGGAWAIVRYLPNGSLDTSFAQTGIITVRDLGSGTGYAAAYAAVVQPDNMLVVAGYAPTSVPYKNRTFVRNQLYVLRYDQNGALDPNFGSGGKVRVSDPDFPASPTEARAVTLQSDHKIVVLASYDGSPAEIRLKPDGTLDKGPPVNNTFGRLDGTDRIGQFIYLPSVSAGFAIAVQPINGKEYIVVAGEDRPNKNFSVFRLTPQGDLDTTFGSGGVVTTNLVDGAQEFYEGLAVDSEQRIIAVGESGPIGPDNWNPKMLIARYTQAGALDTTFDSDGIVSPPPRINDDYVHTVAIQPDGRIVVAGSISTNDNLYYMSAWRFNVDGSPDPSFGANGWVRTEPPSTSNNGAVAMALQPDGKMVLAGRAALARYFSYLPQQPAYDIAVYGITASPSSAFQGDTITAQVTVGNNGTESVTGMVTVTENPGGTNLGTQPVSLAPGETSTPIFSWQTTTSTATGNYTLLALATITTSGVTDEQPANNSRITTVTVVPFTLTALGYKVKNLQTVDLSWTGTRALSVDIYRNGPKIKTTSNTGKYTDNIGVKGSGTYNYKVCDAGSTRCSNPATVAF